MDSKTAQNKRPVNGILLLDKPSGVTSNRILQRVKRLFHAKKAGHTGTLDPMATGMLPICFGAATRVSGLMLDASKKYLVTAQFGTATDTGDATGLEVARHPAPELPMATIRKALASFTGEISQIPPMYSAVKHDGRRLYSLAREGQQVERKPRTVRIQELVLQDCLWPALTLSVHCSKGTYVRTLVTDLAEALGTVAHVSALRRLAVGIFGADQMVTLEALESAAAAGTEELDRYLLGVDAALVGHPAVSVSQNDARLLRHGRGVHVAAASPQASVRIYDQQGGFVGLGHLAPSGELRPSRIFPA